MKKTMTIIIIAVFIIVLAYIVFFPKNTFVMIPFINKGMITLSETGIEQSSAPDLYSENGFSHIEPYISKLTDYSDNFKSLIISVPDGDKALGLNSKSGVLSVGFMVEWKKEPEKEKLIRDYFQHLEIAPFRDYLADNGETRVIEYHIEGFEVGEKKLAGLVKDILIKLCDISEEDPLEFYYSDRN